MNMKCLLSVLCFAPGSAQYMLTANVDALYISALPEHITIGLELLKSSLDIINEKYLSKYEIYEYLSDYNETMKLSHQNPDIPIYLNYLNYVEEKDPKKASYYHYTIMIKLHLFFVNLGMISIIKDEKFSFIKGNDPEIKEKGIPSSLSFFDSFFINEKDKSRFNKKMIFNYIRNAFLHNDNNQHELYQITPDAEYIHIKLNNTTPVPFEALIYIGDVLAVGQSIINYAHYSSGYYIEGQESIIPENLVKSYKKCSKELDKAHFRFKYISKSVPDRFDDINKNIFTPTSIFSQQEFIAAIDSYGNTKEVEYQFSEEMKRLYHKKFKLISEKLSRLDVDYSRKNISTFTLPYIQHVPTLKLEKLVAPIISNYSPTSFSKYNFMLTELETTYSYLFEENITVNKIIDKMLAKYWSLADNSKTINPFEYIPPKMDLIRFILLYVVDDEEREIYNDAVLLRYVFGTINQDSDITIANQTYSAEHLRNAFTHNRFQVYTNEKNEKIFFLFDFPDAHRLDDPHTSPYAWKEYISYNDLIDKAYEIAKNNQFNQTLTLTKKTI